MGDLVMPFAPLTTVIAGIIGVPEFAFLGGIGSTEILMILVVMLLLFGPKQLPELAKTIGKALRGVRKATDEMKEEIGFDEIVDSRPRRPRTYRPRRNIPPSLQEGAGPPPDTRQVSEGESSEESKSTEEQPTSLPSQRNEATSVAGAKPLSGSESQTTLDAASADPQAESTPRTTPPPRTAPPPDPYVELPDIPAEDSEEEPEP